MRSIIGQRLIILPLLGCFGTVPVLADSPDDQGREAAVAFDAALRVLPGFQEQPGVRELAGRLIAMPRNTESFIRSGLDPMTATRRADAAHARLAGWELRTLDQTGEVVILVPDELDETTLAMQLLATGDYDYVEPDWLVHAIALPDDPLFGLQWHLTTIGGPGAWDLETGDPGTVIAICDSGVDLDHPDLVGALVSGYNAVDGIAQADGGAVDGLTNHGTQVAGSAGATGNNATGVTGVGWSLGIMPVRVSNQPFDTAFISDINEGAMWAIDHGARIANASFSGVQTESVATTGDYIASQGGVYVWAAGNSAAEISFFDHANVLIVGATDPIDLLASFSNFGVAVDVVAPGVDIYTTSLAGLYGPINGTSFSAPITAGVLGLIWSAHPGLSQQAAIAILELTAADLGSPGDDDVFGAGRVDAAAAVQLAVDAMTMPLAPVARADTGFATSDAATPIDVMANDIDLNGDEISIVSFDAVSVEGGIVTQDGDLLLYERPAGFEGVDAFEYTIEDRGGLESSAVVMITVIDVPVFGPRLDVAMPDAGVLSGPSGIAAGDVDADGDLDLAVSVWDLQGSTVNEGVLIVTNDGDGTWTAPPSAIATGGEVMSVDAADLNGDGRADIVVGNEATDSVTVLLAVGDGSFAATDLPAGDGPRDVEFVDLNDDGVTDLAAANWEASTVSVWLGTGVGTFVSQGAPTTAVGGGPGIGPFGLTAADVDDDGAIDLVTSNVGVGDLTTLRGNNSGSFSPPVITDTPSSGHSIVAARLDGDDLADVAVVYPGFLGQVPGAGISIATGFGAFGGTTLNGTGQTPMALDAADLDGDGDPEIVVVNLDSRDVVVLIGLGDGSVVRSPIAMPLPFGPRGVTLADLDGDGDRDIAVANHASDSISIFLNETPMSTPGDVTGDGIVNIDDLLAVVAAWGPCPGCPEDLDGDGEVGVDDLLIVVGNWTA